MMKLNMDKPALRAHFGKVSQLYGDININTTGVHVVGNVCVWEFVFDCTIAQEEENVPYKKGDKARLYGIGVLEWRDGKIVVERDYGNWDVTV
jgi:hypothetical protein